MYSKKFCRISKSLICTFFFCALTMSGGIISVTEIQISQPQVSTLSDGRAKWRASSLPIMGAELPRIGGSINPLNPFTAELFFENGKQLELFNIIPGNERLLGATLNIRNSELTDIFNFSASIDLINQFGDPVVPTLKRSFRIPSGFTTSIFEGGLGIPFGDSIRVSGLRVELIGNVDTNLDLDLVALFADDISVINSELDHPIPEPSTLVLAVLGFGLCLALRYKA